MFTLSSRDSGYPEKSRKLSLVGFDIGGDRVDALEVFLGDARHGHAESAIDKRDDFEGVYGIKADFITEKGGIELQDVAVDTEIRHKEGLELVFHFFRIHNYLFFLPKDSKLLRFAEPKQEQKGINSKNKG
jgi:hypothetical protein